MGIEWETFHVRWLEVLNQFAQGKNNIQAREALGISGRTVQAHLRDMLTHVRGMPNSGVQNRMQLILAYGLRGLPAARPPMQWARIAEMETAIGRMAADLSARARALGVMEELLRKYYAAQDSPCPSCAQWPHADLCSVGAVLGVTVAR
ncbi:MAG: LuxR C-terminal-related transcriptional regulator [Dehalococcoidia bacterium]|nr:LuxR C-terminal-related transcriptional regulator [Dehalococcoidia bacterium]